MRRENPRKQPSTSLPLNEVDIKEMHSGKVCTCYLWDKVQEDKEEPQKVEAAAVGWQAGCLHFTKSSHLEPLPQVSSSAYHTSNYSNVVT